MKVLKGLEKRYNAESRVEISISFTLPKAIPNKIVANISVFVPTIATRKEKRRLCNL